MYVLKGFFLNIIFKIFISRELSVLTFIFEFSHIAEIMDMSINPGLAKERRLSKQKVSTH